MGTREQAVLAQLSFTPDFDGAALGGGRRNERVREVVDALARQPDASFPAVFGTSASLEAFYRLVNNGAVTLQTLLESHVTESMRRAAVCGEVLVIHDTTECEWRRGTPRDDLMSMGAGTQGFLAHCSLLAALDESRLPLGMARVETWTRRPAEADAGEGAPERTRAQRRRQRSKAPDKESLRWSRGIDAVEASLPEGVSAIHVADREGDMYGLLAELSDKQRRFVIRMRQDRRIAQTSLSQASWVLEAVGEVESLATREVPLSARGRKEMPDQRRKHPERAARTAVLHVGGATVALRRTDSAGAHEPATTAVNVVHVWEPDPPQVGQRCVGPF